MKDENSKRSLPENWICHMLSAFVCRDWLYIVEPWMGEMYSFDIDPSSHTSDKIFELDVKQPPTLEAKRNSWGTTRCIACFGDYVIVGSVPCTLHLLKKTDCGYTKIDTVDLSTVFNEAIYDIALDPRDW